MPQGRLIALDGVDGTTLGSAARDMAAEHRTEKPCVSVWDASGIFSEVALATVGAGDPSARTLLLLYAADLAYRVRAEIEPALKAGRLVIAAPYIGTAVAYADAVGLDPLWVQRMLAFAPAADRTLSVDGGAHDRADDRKGFVELCCQQIPQWRPEAARAALVARAAARLRAQA